MIKIVIPSHKRADRVLTLKLVPDAIVCVAESQKEEYERYNPDVEIVTHPDDVKGLVSKRNWMARHFGELFMLDDDLIQFKRLDISIGEPSAIKSSKEIKEKIDYLASLAKMLGIHLFGFKNATTPMMYNEFKPLQLNSTVTGRSYGVYYNDNIHWSEEFSLKEDLLISCWARYKGELILTDNRYTFIQKDTMTNAGGLSQIRSKSAERENCMRLRQWFGECVRLKTSRTNGKDAITDKSEYNVSVKF